MYEGAIRQDGSLFFPKRLNQEKLAELRKSMGVYKYTNQYLNQVIPDEEQDFKKSWLRGYLDLPPKDERYTFIFVDPAISLQDGADYTATVVVHVDYNKKWYLEMAYRQRITAPDTVRWIFKLFDEYQPMAIGVEDVAYQKALLHFLHEEMLRRGKILPIKGIKRGTAAKDGSKNPHPSKAFRIRSLIPRFEFGNILINQNLDDFILEYTQFPRGAHDDLLDALSSVEEIVVYPDKPKEVLNVRDPNSPDYERAIIRQLHKQARSRPSTEDDED